MQVLNNSGLKIEEAASLMQAWAQGAIALTGMVSTGILTPEQGRALGKDLVAKYEMLHKTIEVKI